MRHPHHHAVASSIRAAYAQPHPEMGWAVEERAFGLYRRNAKAATHPAVLPASWRWKDEDELVEVVERGLFTHEQAADFRAEGERALEWLLARSPPYDRPWEDWRPPPDCA